MCIDVLFSTGNATLVVHNDTDNVLGVGRALCGFNMTGKILMELREKITDMINRPVIFDDSIYVEDASVCSDPDENGLY
jgi:hypothetical protein